MAAPEGTTLRDSLWLGSAPRDSPGCKAQDTRYEGGEDEPRVPDLAGLHDDPQDMHERNQPEYDAGSDDVSPQNSPCPQSSLARATETKHA